MKSFLKGDRVTFAGKGQPGTVAEDTTGDTTWVCYDNMPNYRAASATCRLEYHTALTAEVTSRSFSVELPEDKFQAISDGSALDEELMRAGAFAIECNGHYGYAYFFSLSEEDVPNLGRYLQIIERHLQNA